MLRGDIEHRDENELFFMQIIWRRCSKWGMKTEKKH